APRRRIVDRTVPDTGTTDRMPVSRGTAPTRSTELTFRLALLGGLVVFGLVITFVVPPPAPAPTADTLGLLRMVGMGIWSASISSLLLTRRWAARAPDHSSRFTRNLVALALAEAAGLYGGIFFLLSRDPLLYLGGVALFVTTFVVLPPIPT